jgi:tetratricopeptide (TPR) repeat protein
VCLVVKAHQTGSLYRDTATQDLLRRFAAQEGVAPVVVLSEDVGPEELASLYRAADCLVQPYRAEGFCLPALEALACGVPVIATAGGPTDAFVDDTCGWRIAATECTAPDDWLPAELLVDPALGAATMLEPDPDDLAAKLQAATDPTARNARARATRARAEEWTWERTGRVAAARVRALAGTPPRRLATPRREAVADVAARGALDDLSTAAQVDVATGAASGRKASRHHPGRPGSRGKRAKQRRANARPELPQIATGGAYSRLLEGLVATSDSATAYGFVRESATRLVAGAPTFPGRWPTGLTLVAATELTAQIERDPRQPALLAELGVTLFGLGEAAVAETVFRAILRLDPTFEHVASNLAALRAPRARAPLATDPAQRALSRLLAERAARVVAALEPETALGVSLCMIVRDEEELLEDCLASAAPWVDEIVVVDTGSTDGTRAVAARYGARIIDHPWSDSFAEARNVSIEAATGDWILWLDADERLDPASGPILRSLATRTWRTAFYAEIENETGEDGREVVVHEALRMWRNSPEIRFKGRLHEQLDGIAFEVPDRLERPDLRIRHLGYRPEIARAKGKAKRNRTLLAGEREGAFTWFSRASELQAEGDSAGALPLFDKAWAAVTNDRSTTAPHYLPVLALRRVRAARSSGDAAGGLARVHDGLERFLDHTELVVEAALCARALGALDDAAAFAQQARALGEAPARYAPQVGSGTIVPLGLLATIRAEQGRLAEARGLVTALEETYPEARAAVEAARAEVDAWQHAFAAAVDVFVGDGLPPAGVMPRVTGPLALALAACARPADGDARAFETLLEGLLDLERFEAFEQALGFWWKLDAPAAELHDRLAQIYLRRGFTEAARDEWLVAWEEERDARAVVGLARIEAGHGNNALAAELAEEARAFDAVRAEAEALLASLAA